MKINELVPDFGLEFINDGRVMSDRTLEGCYIGDLLSNVMANAQDGEIWLTVQTHENVIAIAVLLNLAGVVFLEGHKPKEETIRKADREGVPLFCTGFSAFELAGLLYTKGVRRKNK